MRVGEAKHRETPCAVGAHGSCQNGPVRPRRSRIAWFCSRVWGCHFGGNRSFHHACTSSLSFLTVIVRPGARPASQRSMCSSDRKRFIMVLQVKTMLSHQWAAGTAQWKPADALRGRSSSPQRPRALRLHARPPRRPQPVLRRLRGRLARLLRPRCTHRRPGRQADAARNHQAARRRRQVTYNGWPLYYYAHERAGEIRCQNVRTHGGTWLVVRPSGALLR